MMTATVTTDRMPSIAGRLLVNDLVIHEFDQWANPSDLVAGFTQVCWVPEFTAEHTE